MCLAAATTRGETRRPQAYVGGLPTPNKAERPLETQTTGWLLHTALGFGPGWAIGGSLHRAWVRAWAGLASRLIASCTKVGLKAAPAAYSWLDTP
jgi:hypothetical protein